MIQLSILKITEYGPWTLTLGSDREHELQMLQASLYKKIQQLFSEKNCLVFLNKSDEFFVVSNGLTLDDHIEIQKSLKESFEVSLTISIGYGNTPFEANLKAYDGKQNNVILNEEHTIFGFIDNELESDISIMHLDVDDLKSKRQDNSPYEISLKILSYILKLQDILLKKTLSHFLWVVITIWWLQVMMQKNLFKLLLT